MKNNFLFSLLVAFLFFVAAFVTLDDYSISWDETIHFRRGQAYLHQLLTGDTNYDNLSIKRRSIYQFDGQNAEFFSKNGSGHPPLNGELAAFSNFIFYQKLGIVDDVESHHLFNIAASSLLVFVVSYFAISTLGLFASFISVLSLVLYPLFWAESHFNVKDPPLAAFFALTIWSFYEAVNRKSASWLFVSIISFGVAMSTKFNAIFIPFILVPFSLIIFKRYLSKPIQAIVKIPIKIWFSILLGSLIMLVIFFGSWPFVRTNFPSHLFEIFGFYKSVGTNIQYQPASFYIFGFNKFPSLWVLFTTPPLVLILLAASFFFVWKKGKKLKLYVLLWLLWLLVPIIRVTLPGSAIYGGSRQIMEFLPAMALLTGYGASEIVKIKALKKGGQTLKLLLIFAFIWPLFVIIRLHPNQNVYFNFLIGGLKGAQEQNFPSWGFSFGNAYLGGVKWINANVEPGAKLAVLQGTQSNIPKTLLRKDIDFERNTWSGINREGEYIIELVFNDTGRSFHYAWEYVNNFLEPVYEETVDGVAILKVWKNDLEHTKPSHHFSEKLYVEDYEILVNENILTFNFDHELTLSRIIVKFNNESECTSVDQVVVETSLDSKNWLSEKDAIPFPQVGQKSNLLEGQIEYHFAARKARSVRFLLGSQSSCDLESSDTDVFHLE